VWFFDTSKQALQCLLVHFLNIGLAQVFNRWLDMDIDSCCWYWVNLTLDCTLGISVMFLILRMLQCVYCSRWIGRPDLARCGDYGMPPRWRVFQRQLLDWLAIAAAVKIILAGATLHWGATLAGVARVLLGWLDAYPRAKLFVVMVLTPLALNILALWTADSFLQADLQEGAVVNAHAPAFMRKFGAEASDEESASRLMTFGEWKLRRLQSSTAEAMKASVIFGA